MEVAPGIHRIEGDLGERYVCQYLLVGEERTLLVDTGLRDMPEQVIAPYLAELGRSLADLDDVLISHADVDHCGGNRALRAARAGRAPPVRRGRPRRGSSPTPRCWPATTAGTRPTASGPSPEDVAFLERELGGDAPVDVGLHGGETLRLGPDWRVEVLALPGHTPGHLGLWDPRSGAAIIIDAALADGVYDRAGNRLIPPRYYSAARLRGDDPPPARARPGAAADRALRRHGARRGARVPRPLAGLRARGPRRGRAAVRAGRPTCGR